MRTPAAPRRSVATASVALAVLTAGLTLAFIQAAHPAAAARVPMAPDHAVSTPRLVTDIPRVHPLWAPERNAVHAA